MNNPRIILLVDGSATDRAIYQDWLNQDAQAAFTVLEADCGSAVLEICQEAIPDLILLSDRLPDMNGLEVLERFTQQTLRQVPVVILSEQENVAAVVRAMKRGAQDYLVKSTLTAAIFYRTVQEAIAGQPTKMPVGAGTSAPVQAQPEEVSPRPKRVPQVALRREDYFASAILDVIGALVIVLDRQGRIVCFNRVCEQVSGYTFAEMEGQPVWGLILPEELDPVSNVFEALCSGQFRNQYENYWVTKDGDRRLISWSNTVSVNVEGNVEYVIGTGIDITEQKQVETALRLSEEQRRLAVDLTQIGTWDWQILTGHITWSDSHFHLLGLVPGETDVCYETWRDRVHPEDIERVEQTITDALNTHTIYEAEYRVVHPDGNIRWIVARGQALYDEADRPIRMIGIIIDISERARLEAECNRAEAECRQAESSLRRSESMNLANITERLRAEQALRQLNQELEQRVEQRTVALQASEALLQAVFNQAAIGINLTKADGRYLKVNQAYCDIVGYTSEELLQTDYIQVTHPEDRGKSLQQRRQLFAGELNLFSLEKRYIRKNGGLVWAHIALSAVYKATGEVDYAICVVEDISQRKHTEEQLRLSEARYRAIVEDQTELIARFASDTTLLFVNEAYSRYFGVERETIIGTSYAPTIFEADQKQVARLVQSMSFDNPTVTIENRVVINGEVRWTQWINRMLFDEQENFIEYQAVGRDITARKQVEKKLRQQLDHEILVATITQRIRESLDLSTTLNTTVAEIQQLLQADRVLVYRLVADGSGQTIAESRNPDWQPMLELGFSSEVFPPEGYQRYVKGHIYVLSDRSQEQVIPCMTQFMETFDIQAKLVAPIIHQDALWGLLIVHQCSAPRQWQGWEARLLQQLANQLAIATKQSALYQQLQFELREREQTQELLEQSNDYLRVSNLELARATRHKDEFLANMSHELRTPLNAILGMSEALLEEICGPLTERQHKAISTIATSGTHLLDLINDILDLAKIEAGKLELQLASVAIAALCDSSLTVVKPIADKKGIQLIAKVSPNIGQIEADDRRLQQVLMNLLSNAVKFTPAGGSVTLEAWLEEDPGTRRHGDTGTRGSGDTGTQRQRDRETASSPHTPILHLSVCDTGIGIAQSDFDQIFQPFRQIDNSLSRQYTGTGLGLALAQRIVKMHQGTVTVKSAVGQGSCFTLCLPQRQVSRSTKR